MSEETRRNVRRLTRPALTAALITSSESVRNSGRMEALGWALTHEPTRQAYARCTGEEIGDVLDRFVAFIEQNLTGKPGEIVDDVEAA